MRKSLIATVVVATLSLLAAAAHAFYYPSHDGRNRGVLIVNQSPWTVTSIYARPLSGPHQITGDRIPNNTIQPRWQQNVIFDDGHGACLYSITFNGSNGGAWTATLNVCTTSRYTLN